MKYVLDRSLLLEVIRGNRTVIEVLSWYRKHDVVVPEPVVVSLTREAKLVGSPGARKRWELLIAELPRSAWTSAVTERLLTLDPPDGDDLVAVDVLAAAYALAADAVLLTLAPARFKWVEGLRIEDVPVPPPPP
jgi:predicted nucleic acid-binding protein